MKANVSKFLIGLAMATQVAGVVLGEGPVTTANVPNPYGAAQMFPSVETIPGGARIKAQFHMAQLSSKVSWMVLAPVSEPNGNRRLIELALVDDAFVHDNTNYHATRTYDLDYAKVNAWLKTKAPKSDLEIGPGTPLYVYARWMNDPVATDPYTNQTSVRNHEWGGIARNGLVVLPGGVSSQSNLTGFTRGGTTTSLDVSNHISSALASKYPNSGLWGGGTRIGSRFENELKLHIDVNDIPKVSAFFERLEKDPSLVEQTFGQGWKLVANRKYVGQPMIDEYMDNTQFQAAEKGMALRYRNGSGVTSLNFKPNDGNYAGKGVYERIEYDFRNFPDLSSSPGLSSFIDSNDAFNPLQLIPQQISGAKASDFFKRVAKLTDERLKYELTAPSGDQVEISVDHVKARILDAQGKEQGHLAEFGQLEVEVNHLGAQGSSRGTGGSSYLTVDRTAHGSQLDPYLAQLPKGSVISTDIPAVFHGEDDFKPDSPIKTVNAGNFKLAFDVFDKIRDGAFGQAWLPSGQKYAVVAAALDQVPPERYAPSVDRMIREKLKKDNPTPGEKKQCLQLLVKLTPM